MEGLVSAKPGVLHSSHIPYGLAWTKHKKMISRQRNYPPIYFFPSNSFGRLSITIKAICVDASFINIYWTMLSAVQLEPLLILW